jgi:hypothetical protein
MGSLYTTLNNDIVVQINFGVFPGKTPGNRAFSFSVDTGGGQFHLFSTQHTAGGNSSVWN